MSLKTMIAWTRKKRAVYRLLWWMRPPNGVVDWLLACPEKGYFVPVESESTDTMPEDNADRCRPGG